MKSPTLYQPLPILHLSLHCSNLGVKPEMSALGDLFMADNLKHVLAWFYCLVLPKQTTSSLLEFATIFVVILTLFELKNTTFWVVIQARLCRAISRAAPNPGVLIKVPGSNDVECDSGHAFLRGRFKHLINGLLKLKSWGCGGQGGPQKSTILLFRYSKKII